MHSSGMHTTRLLTISQYALGRGGCVSQHALGRGVSTQGVSRQGVSAQGVSAQGWVWQTPPRTRGTHPPVYRQTPMKT